MPYIIFLIFLAFATAVAILSQQLSLNLYLPVLALSIIVGQVTIFCFTTGAVMILSEEKRSGVRLVHYGISLGLIAITSAYFLFSSVVDVKVHDITVMYILGTLFCITSFDAVFKFVKVGILNINSSCPVVVQSTRMVSMITIMVGLLVTYLVCKYFLNVDLKINL